MLPGSDAAVAEGGVLIAIDGMAKRFGTGSAAVDALVDVSLAIRAGEFFTLLGPSGCGKTTLLRLIAGFETPSAGHILLAGRDIAADPPFRRPVNTVFQSYALFPHLTVAENVAFGLRRLRHPKAECAARVAAMLRLVRLEGFERRRPHELSGGQQQRVALARALAPSPRVLLLDEPMSALDAQLRRAMQGELKRIQRETGVAFVLVTHDQGEALSLSDRIAVMEAGRVLQVGSPEAVYARPNCRFVAGFVGEANILDGHRVGLAAPYAALRPEHVHVTTAPVPGALALPGRVAAIAFAGATTSCLVALDGGETIRVQRGDLPVGLVPGRAVTCIVAPGAPVPLER